MSILVGFMDDYGGESSSLLFTGGACWTITYLQIYNTVTSKWEIRASYEYVSLYRSLLHTYVSTSTKQYTSTFVEEESFGDLYSQYYADKDWLKDRAVQAYINGVYAGDTVDNAYFHHEGKIVLTLDRWMEYIGYNPIE